MNTKTPAIIADTQQFELVFAGEKVDARTSIARRFKSLASDLVMQLGDITSPTEKMMIGNAATLAVLCERDSLKLLRGEPIEEENYRRNVQALGGLLVKLGLAKKSRDITKGDSRLFDAHAAAILDAE